MAVVTPILIFMLINDIRQLKCVLKNAPAAKIKRSKLIKTVQREKMAYTAKQQLPTKVVANNPNA